MVGVSHLWLVTPIHGGCGLYQWWVSHMWLSLPYVVGVVLSMVGVTPLVIGCSHPSWAWPINDACGLSMVGVTCLGWAWPINGGWLVYDGHGCQWCVWPVWPDLCACSSISVIDNVLSCVVRSKSSSCTWQCNNKVKSLILLFVCCIFHQIRNETMEVSIGCTRKCRHIIKYARRETTWMAKRVLNEFWRTGDVHLIAPSRRIWCTSFVPLDFMVTWIYKYFPWPSCVTLKFSLSHYLTHTKDYSRFVLFTEDISTVLHKVWPYTCHHIYTALSPCAIAVEAWICPTCFYMPIYMLVAIKPDVVWPIGQGHRSTFVSWLVIFVETIWSKIGRNKQHLYLFNW